MLLSQVRKTVESRELLQRGAHVLVACSGGPDSVALAHALHTLRSELGITLAIASVDHGLRPEAKDEVAAVLQFADQLGVPGYGLCVQVPEGPSLQQAARRVRYEALAAQARSCGADVVATGHTLDDQAETVLARILRGSGCLGLAAIDPLRDDGVIRPLIDTHEEEVQAYLAHHALAVATDPSNQDPRFERVRLRTQLLPALRREDPRICDHLAALADEARALKDWLEDEIDETALAGADSLQASVLAAQPQALRALTVARWVKLRTGLAPGRDHITAILAQLRAPGEVLLGSGWVVLRRDERVVLEQRDRTGAEV